jgi:hypothetical protein
MGIGFLNDPFRGAASDLKEPFASLDEASERSASPSTGGQMRDRWRHLVELCTTRQSTATALGGSTISSAL